MAILQSVLFVILLSQGVRAHSHTKVPETCAKLANLYFIVDGSDSMSLSNFRQELSFVNSVVEGLMLNYTDGFAVGVIAFSRDIQEIPLGTARTKDDLYSRVNNLTHDRDGTYTHLAIQRMTSSFRVSPRNNVQKIGILLTDGLSKVPTETANEARRAKDFGVQLIVVGIGSNVNENEIKAIASTPNLVFMIPDFNALTQLAISIATTVCPEPLTYTATPTTSTTTSTTTTTTPNYGPCDRCEYLNGVGYSEHPDDCTLFYQCFQNGYGLVPVLKHCPFGLFWDQHSLLCRKPQHVPHCAQRICSAGARHHTYSGNCRAYWTCYDTKPLYAHCCPEGHAYVANVGCVPNTGCQDLCPPYKAADPGICNRRPGPDESQFYEDLSATEAILRKCGPGSGFDAGTCYCSKFLTVPHIPPIDACAPALYIPFDNDVSDHSINKAYVGNNGVQIRHGLPGAIGGGVGYFDGYSSATIWQFSNDDFRQQFILTFRYQESPVSVAQTRSEALVSNRGCNTPCSIAVTFDRSLGETTGTVRTTGSQRVTATTTNTRTGWKQVQYTYNGQHLSLLVDGQVQHVVATGDIERVKAAIEIGAGCEQYNKFTGYIDELYIYKCLV